MSDEARKRALKNLGIKPSHRVILSLDGGGIRGIMTIELLRKLEEVAEAPCHEFVDMVAGTSTGGIIAGLIAKQNTAAQIAELYRRLVKKVFKSAGMFANRFLNPPEYTKSSYRSALRRVVGEDTTLRDACSASGIDIMITAKDVAAGEETFFTCIRNPANRRFTGTYRNVLLRAAMESTMSAPTYFHPFERFVDGGVTTYNSPAMAAIIEAIRYGPKDAYNMKKLTVLSFGTGCRPQFVALEDVADPDGSDSKFWLQWLMTEAGDDAADLQNAFLRTQGLFGGFEFRRFQISLDRESIRKLPNKPVGDLDETDADWLWDLTDEELASIQLDNVDYFPIMQVIGRAFAEKLVAVAQKDGHKVFGRDLINAKRRDLLVSSRGDVNRIKQQLSNSAWVDDFRPV